MSSEKPVAIIYTEGFFADDFTGNTNIPKDTLKVGRNDLYSCGSSDKYKKCCGW